MKQLSSIDLYFLTKEFKELFENQRIDSFYFDDGVFYIKFYVKQKGPIFLVNQLGKFIYYNNKKAAAASTFPINFVQYLRKYLKNAYLMKLEQIDNERILKLSIDKKVGEEMRRFYIFIELFSTGNVIVVDSQMNIINSLIKKKFKDRKVLVNEVYELPPQKEISIFNLDIDIFKKKLLSEKEFRIGAFLATQFGIGGKFANEVCALAGVEKGKFTNDLNEKEISSLVENLVKLPSSKIDSKGVVKIDDSKGSENDIEKKFVEILDFMPFNLISVDSSKPKKDFESFNDVVRDYFVQFLVKVDGREKELKKELDKLKKRLKTQEKHKEKVLIDYDKFNSLGNLIYENYGFVEELLGSINKSAKQKGWEHIQEVIKSNDILKKKVKKLNYKNNEIILDL